MAGLFGRLLTYRSPHKTNLEDFLTEIWVDLLNRVPPDRWIDVCCDLLLKAVPPNERERWVKLAKATGDDLRWETQNWITILDSSKKRKPKRPDVILYAGNTPLAVIECKINAGFTGRFVEGVDGDGEWIPQMEDYASWLSNQTERGFLCLMTHLTEPPKDYDTKWRHDNVFPVVQRWGLFYRWLSSEGRNYWSDADPSSNVLIEELLLFLEENDMTGDELRSKDTATIQIAVTGSYERLLVSMNRVHEWVRSSPEIRTGRKSPVKIEKGAVWDWIYVRQIDDRLSNNWFIGWGIWFPQPNDPFYGEDVAKKLPNGELFFLCIDSDDENDRIDIKLTLNKKPLKWIQTKRGFICATPLSAMHSLDKDFSEKVTEWMKPAFDEVVSLLKGSIQSKP